jgi:hypothetical protein
LGWIKISDISDLNSDCFCKKTLFDIGIIEFWKNSYIFIRGLFCYFTETFSRNLWTTTIGGKSPKLYFIWQCVCVNTAMQIMELFPPPKKVFAYFVTFSFHFLYLNPLYLLLATEIDLEKNCLFFLLLNLKIFFRKKIDVFHTNQVRTNVPAFALCKV